MVHRARQRVGKGVRLDNGLANRDWYLPSTTHTVGTISSGVVDVGLEPALLRERDVGAALAVKNLDCYTLVQAMLSEKFGIDMVHYTI